MAPEGRFIILPLVALAVVASCSLVWVPQTWMKILTGALWLLAVFVLQFFRDPQRTLPDDPQAFVSPADGKVVAIEPVGFDEHIQGDALRISIFLSVFSVHAQKVPFDARVDSTHYQSGSFLAAFNPRASEENEQSVSFFTAIDGKFKVKQIAGILARRVLNYMELGQSVRRGDRLGYIRFGSRVDIVVPADFQVQVKVGQSVKGTTSIIGYFAS